MLREKDDVQLNMHRGEGVGVGQCCDGMCARWRRWLDEGGVAKYVPASAAGRLWGLVSYWKVLDGGHTAVESCRGPDSASLG